MEGLNHYNNENATEKPEDSDKRHDDSKGIDSTAPTNTVRTKKHLFDVYIF